MAAWASVNAWAADIDVVLATAAVSPKDREKLAPIVSRLEKLTGQISPAELGECLKATNIGRKLNQLRKCLSESDELRARCRDLIKKFKDIIDHLPSSTQGDRGVKRPAEAEEQNIERATKRIEIDADSDKTLQRVRAEQNALDNIRIPRLKDTKSGDSRSFLNPSDESSERRVRDNRSPRGLSADSSRYRDNRSPNPSTDQHEKDRTKNNGSPRLGGASDRPRVDERSRSPRYTTADDGARGKDNRSPRPLAPSLNGDRSSSPRDNTSLKGSASPQPQIAATTTDSVRSRDNRSPQNVRSVPGTADASPQKDSRSLRPTVKVVPDTSVPRTKDTRSPVPSGSSSKPPERNIARANDNRSPAAVGAAAARANDNRSPAPVGATAARANDNRSPAPVGAAAARANDNRSPAPVGAAAARANNNRSPAPVGATAARANNNRSPAPVGAAAARANDNRSPAPVGAAATKTTVPTVDTRISAATSSPVNNVSAVTSARANNNRTPNTTGTEGKVQTARSQPDAVVTTSQQANIGDVSARKSPLPLSVSTAEHVSSKSRLKDSRSPQPPSSMNTATTETRSLQPSVNGASRTKKDDLSEHSLSAKNRITENRSPQLPTATRSAKSPNTAHDNSNRVRPLSPSPKVQTKTNVGSKQRLPDTDASRSRTPDPENVGRKYNQQTARTGTIMVDATKDKGSSQLKPVSHPRVHIPTPSIDSSVPAVLKPTTTTTSTTSTSPTPDSTPPSPLPPPMSAPSVRAPSPQLVTRRVAGLMPQLQVEGIPPEPTMAERDADTRLTVTASDAEWRSVLELAPYIIPYYVLPMKD